MKRKFLTMLLAIAASLCLCLGLAACGEKGEANEHTHNWVWKNNSFEHWQICETDNVEKSGSRSAHFDNDEDGKCDECKYSIEDSGPVVPTEYTVTYNANGGFFEDGEETKSVKVKENEKLETPEEPTRDDFTFAHWCTDSSLDTEWNFESDVVTHTTTLYAKWETVIVEHNVTFILNYEGAEEVVKSTENNLITFIPTRDDYVFNGWWLSDGQTESGEYILAQKYDTAEPVTEDGLVLVAEWVEKSTVSSQLPAPSVSINGNVFSWAEVTGAVSYDIRVYESGSREEKSRETVFATSWTFPSGYNAGYYTVKIRAMGDGKTTVNSSYVSKSYGHLILSTISKIDFDITSSILTWTAVKNATSYVLYVNNAEVETLSYTTYDLSDYEAGEYSIKIIAQRDGYQSSTTTKTIQKLRLKTPNIRLFVDNQNDCYVVMWDSVVNADTYLLNFGGTEVKVTDETSYSFDNSASFWKGTDSITLSMTAFDSDADYLVSNPTAELTVTQIYTVTIEKNMDGVGTVTTTGAVYIPQTFKIDFDLNGATGKVNTQYVTAKNAITYPTIPTRSGYVFRGWYTTKSCYELYDFTAEVTKDITLYAGWYEITTEGDGNYILDIISNYYSSSKAYSVSTSGTTSSNAKYMYFRALTRGTYTLYYKNSSSTTNNGTYLNVYNATQGRTLYSNSRINSTSYTSLQMTLEAGDVVYIRNYAYNSSYSATFYFYITGASKPSAGGLGTGRYLIKGTNDSTSSDPKIIADLNTPITLTATTTDDRYIFDGWYNGDTLLTKEPSYSYTIASQNPNLTAKWIYYSVTTQKNLEDAGTITSHSDSPIKVGDSVTITAKTNNGYMWLGWYEGDRLVSRDAQYTFTMTSQSVRYTAHWAVCPIVLTKNMDEAGTISNMYVPLTLGQTITITASTKSGYTWLGWYEGDQLKTLELSFEEELTETKKNYEARWACYTLTTTTNDSSAGSFTRKDNVKTAAGQSVTLEARTYSGYTWQGWYEDDQLLSENLSYTFDMPKKSVTYTAKWTYYTLTTTRNDSQAGYFSLTYTNTKITAGEKLMLTAYTYKGYTFIGWYKGDEEVSKDLTYEYTMTKENVSFEARWCKVTLSKNNASAGSVGGLDGTYKVGDQVTITATTNMGYTFIGWYKGDEEVSKDLTYEYTMTKENVSFEARWCKVTLSKNNASAGSVGGLDGTYKVGDQVTITATTNMGYTFIGWYKGDEKVSKDLTYEYTMTKENVTIEARWDYIEGMEKFNFTSTQTTCIITGLKEKDGTQAVFIPSCVTLINENAFSDCNTLKSMTVDSQNANYNSMDGILYNKELTNIKYVPKAITGAIVISDAVISIAKETFINRTSLISVTIGSGTTSIGNSAFKGCSSLATVYWNAENCTEAGNKSYPIFGGCTNLSTVNIGSKVVSIPSYAFVGCGKSLRQVTLPENVTSIGDSAFMNCSNLTTVYWNAKNCTSVGYYPIFEGCANLSTVKIDSNVVSIPSNAFAKCVGLRAITIPASVESLSASQVFAGCSNLESITVASGNKQYKSEGGILYKHYYNSESYRIEYVPKALKGSVTIMNGITTIEGFSGCSQITEIIIPTSAKRIDVYAFNGCTSLTRAIFKQPKGWIALLAGKYFEDSLADPANAANYLTGQYCKYEWECRI